MVAVAFTKVKPAGSTSVSTVFVIELSELFFTLILKKIFSPSFGDELFTSLVNTTSTTDIGVRTTVSSSLFGLSSISFNDFKPTVFVYSFARLVGSRTVAWYVSEIGVAVLISKLDHSIVLLPGFNTPLLLTEPETTEIPEGN